MKDGLDLIPTALSQQWSEKVQFTFLLGDFADGELFAAIVQQWQSKHNQRLHCIAFLANDFSCPNWHPFQTTSSPQHELFKELEAKWPLPIHGFHQIQLSHGSITLTLVFGDFFTQLTELTGPIDCFVLNHQAPHLELMTLKQIWRLCSSDSKILSVLIDVISQDNLLKTGFKPELHPSQIVLTAQCVRAPKSQILTHTTKKAVVIGAGMAGCAVANSLAARNWEIHLIEANEHIASQASGNHIGLCHPTFSLDDNHQARLSRTGFFATQQKLNQLNKTLPDHVFFGCDGHFQLAEDSTAAQQMQQIILEQQLPPQLVSWLNQEEAQAQLNIQSEFGGWWFPEGMWINPSSACRAYIDEYIDKIILQLNTYVDSILYMDGKWHIYGADQQLIAQSEVLILTNAHDAHRLLLNTELALSSSLRSVTKIPTDKLSATPIGLSGNSYLTAEFAGFRCAGASAVTQEMDAATIESRNFAELAKLIGTESIHNTDHAQTRQCVRPNSADRLPLVGAIPSCDPITHSVHQLFHIPKATGLYAALGFGARGLSWHVLAADVLARMLNGEAQGLERTLINAIDPSRFVLRRMRKLSSKKNE